MKVLSIKLKFPQSSAETKKDGLGGNLPENVVHLQSRNPTNIWNQGGRPLQQELDHSDLKEKMEL